ncbi:hypothetical protein EYD45_01675 [Hyunsoonleella flava]|uniref:Uncharacterized protein n=1 Tax=Hyunsoonleella flava TaxID=2527939 RepID=A0A4Q9FH46_9FLAO|nr:hypothetical protein [Hyunsoonleella flava]TBN06619.1 hypothetical protein EYD45_01675 [Hyunsoonleella flava]
MKKIYFLVIGLFFLNVAIAQKQAIKITNLKTAKEKIIQENKRIKVKTLHGSEIKGRFMIEDDTIISIDGVRVDLIDIEELKRNPLLTSILTSGFLIYGGILVAGSATIAGIFVDSTAFLLTLPAAGMIYAGIKSPNFNKNHKKDKGWRFEIVIKPD